MTKYSDLEYELADKQEQIERLKAELWSMRHHAHFGDMVSGAWGATSQIVLLYTFHWTMKDFIIFKDWSVEYRTDYLREIQNSDEKAETPTEYYENIKRDRL